MGLPLQFSPAIEALLYSNEPGQSSRVVALIGMSSKVGRYTIGRNAPELILIPVSQALAMVFNASGSWRSYRIAW